MISSHIHSQNGYQPLNGLISSPNILLDLLIRSNIRY